MKQSESTPTTSTRPQGVPSIIGPDLRVTGNIESSGDLQIEGRIEGDVKSLTLHIGEGATVKGSVSADRLTIAADAQASVRIALAPASTRSRPPATRPRPPAASSPAPAAPARPAASGEHQSREVFLDPWGN